MLSHFPKSLSIFSGNVNTSVGVKVVFSFPVSYFTLYRPYKNNALNSLNSILTNVHVRLPLTQYPLECVAFFFLWKSQQTHKPHTATSLSTIWRHRLLVSRVFSRSAPEEVNSRWVNDLYTRLAFWSKVFHHSIPGTMMDI